MGSFLQETPYSEPFTAKKRSKRVDTPWHSAAAPVITGKKDAIPTVALVAQSKEDVERTNRLLTRAQDLLTRLTADKTKQTMNKKVAAAPRWTASEIAKEELRRKDIRARALQIARAFERLDDRLTSIAKKDRLLFLSFA